VKGWEKKKKKGKGNFGESCHYPAVHLLIGGKKEKRKKATICGRRMVNTPSSGRIRKENPARHGKWRGKERKKGGKGMGARIAASIPSYFQQAFRILAVRRNGRGEREEGNRDCQITY